MSDRPSSKLLDRPFNRSPTADMVTPPEKTDVAIAPPTPKQ
jgi:hypothetical protein